MSAGLRILLTNHGLRHRGGTELYIRDVASALLERGHFPMVYSPILGAVADEIEARGAPVVDSLSAISCTPDLIHGQHHLPAMAAMLHFPKVPAIFVCHGFLHWLEGPPLFPNIMHYVAVDEACRERLITKNAISPDKAHLVLNFADTSRFRKREKPLPPFPKRALLISNYAETSGPTSIVREACEELGIELDVCGISSGHVLDHPEDHLRNYDLVFAKGRAAIEAMIVGAAVIPYQDTVYGAMVTPGNLEQSRARNFGFSMMSSPLNRQDLTAEIRRYDANSAGEVSQRIHQTATLDRAAGELLKIYSSAIADRQGSKFSIESQQLAASRYLGRIANEVLLVSNLQQEAVERNSELIAVTAQRNDLSYHLSEARREAERESSSHQQAYFSWEAQKVCLQAEIASLANELASSRAERAALRRYLAQINASPLIRLRNLVLRIPGLAPLRRVLRSLVKGQAQGSSVPTPAATDSHSS